MTCFLNLDSVPPHCCNPANDQHPLFPGGPAGLPGRPGVQVRGHVQHALPGRPGAPGGAAAAGVGRAVSQDTRARDSADPPGPGPLHAPHQGTADYLSIAAHLRAWQILGKDSNLEFVVKNTSG